jgi:hypothetical protein
MLVVPALLMVSTFRFRSFKTIDLGARRGYQVLILLAGPGAHRHLPARGADRFGLHALASGIIGWSSV